MKGKALESEFRDHFAFLGVVTKSHNFSGNSGGLLGKAHGFVFPVQSRDGSPCQRTIRQLPSGDWSYRGVSRSILSCSAPWARTYPVHFYNKTGGSFWKSKSRICDARAVLKHIWGKFAGEFCFIWAVEGVLDEVCVTGAVDVEVLSSWRIC